MDHCVYCGRLVDFCGVLNKLNECEDCERDRLERESDEMDEDQVFDMDVSRFSNYMSTMSKL